MPSPSKFVVRNSNDAIPVNGILRKSNDFLAVPTTDAPNSNASKVNLWLGEKQPPSPLFKSVQHEPKQDQFAKHARRITWNDAVVDHTVVQVTEMSKAGVLKMQSF